MTVAHDDRTPMGKPQMAPGVGINLIPPTPPALESRGSYTGGSRVPGTPTIDENEEGGFMQRPPLMSRSSSQRTAVKSDSKPAASGEKLARSQSMATAKKGQWQQYKGTGLSLPPGLVATTIATSNKRRNSTQEKKSQAVALAPSPAAINANGYQQAYPPAPVVGEVYGSAPSSVLSTPPRAPRSTSSLSPNPTVAAFLRSQPALALDESHHGRCTSCSSDSRWLPGRSFGRKLVVSPVRIQCCLRGPVGQSFGIARAQRCSQSVGSIGWISRVVERSLGLVPQQSSSEFAYVNHHELSPYAKKMRALSSPSPALPTLGQTVNRSSLMSAINEWESQVPEGEEVTGVSPYASRSTSPHPYPTLPASTVSRSNSVISAVSSPAVVRNAPLGASTNQYLQPPIARSRMSVDELQALDESAVETLSPPSILGVRRGSNASSVESSSPSASQLSLSSTIPTSMPTVPTSYRPNKEPKRFSTNVDDFSTTALRCRPSPSPAALSQTRASRRPSSARRALMPTVQDAPRPTFLSICKMSWQPPSSPSLRTHPLRARLVLTRCLFR